MTTTHSAAALLGWGVQALAYLDQSAPPISKGPLALPKDFTPVTRHWHGQQEPKADHRDDEPLVDAMEWDGGAADELEPM